MTDTGIVDIVDNIDNTLTPNINGNNAIDNVIFVNQAIAVTAQTEEILNNEHITNASINYGNHDNIIAMISKVVTISHHDEQ